MSRTRELSDLLTDVADRLDVPAFGSGTFVSDTTMTRWINQSNRRLGALVRAAFGEEYGAKVGNISVVAGTSLYDLPSDYIRTLDMYYVEGGQRVDVERPRAEDVGSDIGCGPLGYKLIGDSVAFGPTPDQARTIYHRYIPTLFAYDSSGNPIDDLTDTDDYLDGVNGWEEWVVLDCCRKHCLAEDKDPTQFLVEQQQIEADIKRDRSRTAAPVKIRDIYGEY
jgi:hypothetical protein